MSAAGRNARYRAKHAEKVRERDAAYRAENRDKILEKKRIAYAENKYRQREYNEANRAQILEKKRARYLERKEAYQETTRRWLLANAERAKEMKKAYKLANPEKARAWNAKRRAAKSGARGLMSRDIEARLFGLQRGKCANCAVSLKAAGHHLDHIVPLHRGGDHVDSNAQLLCVQCNLRKYNKDPIQWANENGRLL